ncbi:MarR family transcriptional regulator [Rhizobium calliandrae]|uniref:MarR family transcriptional regulator n=1 Tax=Rhizobium calliandrae TaxID=1312182 RepID=A0ABT7KQZ4_9HYPH|nr:MarR family transcriptional regulator [Rhizobium calliandrae]MDL2409688.1 MarR family transcriptional regulator [Rhizobium calliandrae]
MREKSRHGIIKRRLRDLRNQLSVLNRQIGARVDLKEIDHDCLDLIVRDGPLSPKTLAEKAKLHPATMTGVLDRLERAGWATRRRVETDRRAVLVTPESEKVGRVGSLYAGMNARLDQICAMYSDAELEVIAKFLDEVSVAAANAANDLQ